MKFDLADLLGIVGVLMMLGAYFAAQLRRLDPTRAPSLLINLAGSSLVLISLVRTFNLSAFVMEAAWAAVALFGLTRLKPSAAPSGEIRSIGPDEHQAVIALWERCGLTRPWNDPARDLGLALASPGADVLVLHEGGAMAGAVMIGFDGHRGWVYYLGVEPSARGTGRGRRLMAEAEARLAALGAPKVQLMVRDENAAARRFYERLGYERQETQVLGRWLAGGRADQGS